MGPNRADFVARSARLNWAGSIRYLFPHWRAAIRSKDLEPWQLDKIKEPVGVGLGYLSKLCRRIDQTMSPDDPLYQAAYKAQAAIKSLFMTLHYLGCNGTGESRKPER